MPKFNREELIAEAKRRGIKIPSTQTEAAHAIPPTPAEIQADPALAQTRPAQPRVSPFIPSAAYGALEAANPIDIPRSLETLARVPFEKGGLSQRLQSAGEHAKIPGTREIGAGIRSVASGTPYKEELQANKDFEASLDPAGRLTGNLAVALPGIVALGKTVVRSGAKALSKSGGFMESLSNWIKGHGISSGQTERVVDTAVKNADKLKNFKTVGDTFVHEKAQDFVDLVDQYRKFRNANYEAEMTPLVNKLGKSRKIDIGNFNQTIYDALGQSESLSGPLKRELLKLSELYREKGQIDFKTAQDLKKTFQMDFGAMGKRNYIGQSDLDERVVDGVLNSLRGAIDTAVPEVRPINAEYGKASDLIRGIGKKVIGPEESGRFFGAQGGMERSMAKGQEEVALLIDDFAKAYPEAAPTVDDFRSFIAAKAIAGGAQPGGTLSLNPAGNVSARAFSTMRFLKDQPFERGLGLLGYLQRAAGVKALPESAPAIPGAINFPANAFSRKK